MLDIVRLPDPPRVIFEFPPLKLALCQVRFPRLLSVANPADVAPFQRAIKSDYPILLPGPTIEFEVSIGVDANTQPSGPSTQWRFTDREQGWTVVLTQEFVAIETRRYNRFEDFLERLSRLLKALSAHLQPDGVTRIGLRYINEIRGGDVSSRRAIRPELLGLLAVAPFSDLVHQSLQEAVLRLPEDQTVTIRHGLFPSGTMVVPVPGQSLPDEPFYLLDIDAARTFSIPDLPTMDLEDISERIEEYHRVIHRVFRWAVTDEYVQSLGGRAHAD